ncbi:MAG: hypothetical protein AVDCRST_MAG12-3478, partial [uncultured Rubrobacteraceae bacterium]
EFRLGQGRPARSHHPQRRARRGQGDARLRREPHRPAGHRHHRPRHDRGRAGGEIPGGGLRNRGRGRRGGVDRRRGTPGAVYRAEDRAGAASRRNHRPDPRPGRAGRRGASLLPRAALVGASRPAGAFLRARPRVAPRRGRSVQRGAVVAKGQPPGRGCRRRARVTGGWRQRLAQLEDDRLRAHPLPGQKRRGPPDGHGVRKDGGRGAPLGASAHGGGGRPDRPPPRARPGGMARPANCRWKAPSPQEIFEAHRNAPFLAPVHAPV